MIHQDVVTPHRGCTDCELAHVVEISAEAPNIPRPLGWRWRAGLLWVNSFVTDVTSCQFPTLVPEATESMSRYLPAANFNLLLQVECSATTLFDCSVSRQPE